MAREIKKDHELALQLWATGDFLPHQLAILVMDKKQLSQAIL
jgi:3-methyladenine DNA glycosylase AlkD